MIETKNKITSDMNIKRIAIAMMLIITTAGYSQVFTVSGIVEDNQTGKALKDVSVTLPDQRTFTTNSSGFFSFELTTREMPMMLKFTTPEYLKSTYKVERARFNRNRELWLNIKMHPIDSSKVFVSEEEIGNPVLKIPDVNVFDFHIVGDLLYVLIETMQGFDYLQVYNLNDSLLAQIEVDYKYENFYRNSQYECYIADQDYGCMRKVNYKDGKVTLGQEHCVAGFVYWAFADARVGDYLLQQQDIYTPRTLRIFYLTPELTLDFDYWQLRYVASLNNFIVRGDTADYNSIKRECLSGKFANDMQTFISNRIANNPKYKDSVAMLQKFYIDTMYSDWFRVQASSIIYSSLDEAYKIKDDMRDYDYIYIPYCRPTFLQVGNYYYIFNFNSMVITKFDLQMNFISNQPLSKDYFSYFYRRDHSVITSYKNAYAISSSDDLGVVSLINLATGTLSGTQTLLRTITDEHRVEVRNGYIYYISYYAYLEKNLYKEPIKMQPLKGK